MTDPVTSARAARAWPFQQARKILDRLGGADNARLPDAGHVLFETGYGPSGLPHVGTFAEVARTSMVRHAFASLCDLPTKLIAFSDDMDGLRKVPDNIPNADMMAEHVDKPLSVVPDPFGTHDSFAAHNNARLRAFLDRFGFDYEFLSATECYRSGRFDATLTTVLENYNDVTAVVLPELRAERRLSYCPFLPISPKTGVVLQAPAEEVRPRDGTIIFRDEDGARFAAPVTGGHCKLQWRVDWAMRWTALGVDYEMSGKDLIDSVRLSGRICRAIGGRPPEGFTYELFLDENGAKISKSKGNYGLSVEEWLTYGPPESLSLFMYNKPKAAKRLYFDVIPKHVDEYLSWVEKYQAQAGADRLENPVCHIHCGAPPPVSSPISFALLLNLASVCHTEDPSVLWGFIRRYAPEAAPQTHALLDRLVGHAIAYYRDFVKPQRRFRPPDDLERAALEDLLQVLQILPEGADAGAIQTEVYEVGKRHAFANLRDWFRALYEILLGHSQGPRIGSFVALYGVPQTITLIRAALAGDLAGESTHAP